MVLNLSIMMLMEQLKNDASYTSPELAAEAQAKFDCWVSAAASGQVATAKQCRDRFNKTMTAMRDCVGGKIVKQDVVVTEDVQIVADGNMPVETTVVNQALVEQNAMAQSRGDNQYYPDTRNMRTMRGAGQAREGVIIVNNVSVPEHLINPEPVQPMVFNQNIYGGDKSVTKSLNDNSIRNSNNSRCPNQVADGVCPQSVTVNCPAGDTQCPDLKCPDVDCPNAAAPVTVVITEKEQPVPVCPECQKCQECPGCQECQECQECRDCPDCNVDVSCPECQQIPMISEELVTREEFINMMMAMRAELAAINSRLDQIQAAQGEKTMIKVQQIPLEPTQHVMEEVFEIRFDFNKAVIKPEYQELIKQLVSATQENKNIKISVVGHTDTSGTTNYNYALGGRRADAVQKMLIKYGIPASQIVAVSAGEEGLAVPTPDNTPNAENRRVRVVKEVHYTEDPKPVPVEIDVEEYSAGACGEYGCEQ